MRRKAGRLTEAYQMAMEDMEKCEDFFSCQSVFWVCVDMLKQPKEVRSGTDGALMYSIRGLMIKMEEYDKEKVTPIIREGYAWSIVRYLWDNYATLVSIESRKLLADYFAQKLPIPSNLHSAILGVAAKMTLLHPEFKFVSFLKMWNLHNLRPEMTFECLFPSAGCVNLNESMHNGNRIQLLEIWLELYQCKRKKSYPFFYRQAESAGHTVIHSMLCLKWHTFVFLLQPYHGR